MANDIPVVIFTLLMVTQIFNPFSTYKHSEALYILECYGTVMLLLFIYYSKEFVSDKKHKSDFVCDLVALYTPPLLYSIKSPGLTMLITYVIYESLLHFKFEVFNPYVEGLARDMEREEDNESDSDNS